MCMLQNDMNLLLIGGEPDLKIVFIIKWTRVSTGVRGVVQLWKRQRGQPIPLMIQEEVCSRLY